MNLEIERRYRLQKLPIELTIPTYSIEQAYGSDIDGTFRIRERMCNKHITQYFLTRKNNISFGVFEELECEISKTEYQTYYENCYNRIHKSRFNISFNNLIFEVDLFEDKQVILEVELPDIDFPFIMPEFIEDLVVEELTGLKEFSNYNMSKQIIK